MDDFDRAIEFVLKSEGGYSSDIKDPGNWSGGRCGVGVLVGTKYGIAGSSHPTLDIRNITLDDAKSIYKKEYWSAIHGDILPWPLCYIVLDFAVHSGPHRALSVLQSCIGTTPDGLWGPKSTEKLSKVKDLSLLCRLYHARRMAFLQKTPIWETYRGGLTNRMNEVWANTELG